LILPTFLNTKVQALLQIKGGSSWRGRGRRKEGGGEVKEGGGEVKEEGL